MRARRRLTSASASGACAAPRNAARSFVRTPLAGAEAPFAIPVTVSPKTGHRRGGMRAQWLAVVAHEHAVAAWAYVRVVEICFSRNAVMRLQVAIDLRIEGLEVTVVVRVDDDDRHRLRRERVDDPLLVTRLGPVTAKGY